MKQCVQCSSSFEITDADRAFYKAMDLPDPKMCPPCRQQRRLAFRNERTLYKRSCSGSGKSIIGMYPPDTPFPVYDHGYFFGDRWNALDYGRDFDFSRPFFEQFHELMQVAPRILNYSFSNENAEYGNLASWNKNCYMCFEADNNRDCLYCDYSFRCKNTVDCSYATECELCYACSDIKKSYNLRHSVSSINCSDSWFLKNCVGCRDCFGCVNLKNKQYYFYNESLSKEEYEAKVASLQLDTFRGLQKVKNEFAEFAKKFPNKAMHGVQNENCNGDYLNQCKNAWHCYDSSELRDCAYVFNAERIKDGMDIDSYGGIEGAEKVYECHSVGRGSFNVAFGNNVYQDLLNVWYCDNCAHSKDLFGCISMQHAQYCILNKQYSEGEYHDLRKKIINHMKSTGEWGEFFPPSISPFAYNETAAQIHYPLSKNQVESRGWQWSDWEHTLEADRTIPASRLPEIQDIPDDILNWAIMCEVTERPFKITPQELQFYRSNDIPIPHLHPDERYQERMRGRNPRHLYKRQCDKCKAAIQTTYAPKRPETVLCEECYLEKVY
jgi:hypothetical protein